MVCWLEYTGRDSGGGSPPMFTVDCIPSFVTESIEWISIHGSIGDHRVPHPELSDTWRGSWRSQREFEEGIPNLWGSNSKFRDHYHPHPAVFSPSISGRWNSIRSPWNKSMNWKYRISSLGRRAGGMSWLFSFPVTGLLWTQGAFSTFGLAEPSEDWNNAIAAVMVLAATPFASPFRILARARNSIGNDLQNYQALWCCLAWCLSGHMVSAEKGEEM